MFRRTPIALAILTAIVSTHASATDYNLTTLDSTSTSTALTANDTATVAAGQEFGGTTINSDDDLITFTGSDISITVDGTIHGGEDLIIAAGASSGLKINIGANAKLVSTEDGVGNGYDAIDLNGNSSNFVATNAEITTAGTIWVADKHAVQVNDSVGTKITNTGSITANGDTIEAKDAKNLTITNSGTIAANSTGITDYVGTLDEARNDTDGDGFYDVAIEFRGSSSSATDDGNGVFWADGFTLNNQSGGTISSDYETITLYNSTTKKSKNISITNAGTISGTNAGSNNGTIYATSVDTFSLNNSGSLTAAGGSTLNLTDSKGTTSITNSGTISTLVDQALNLRRATGTITINNAEGGMISARGGTIMLESNNNTAVSATITNSGTIKSTGTFNNGVDSWTIYAAGNGGTTLNLTNTATGIISSVDDATIQGVSNSGDWSITNHGIIKSDLDEAINLVSASGNFTLTNTGTISAGDDDAIDLRLTTGNNVITNSGTISAADTSAVDATDSKSITITNSGSITSGGDYTIDAANAEKVVIVNTGTISGGGDKAIDANLVAGQTPTHTATITNSGTISADTDVIHINSDSSITNSGTIKASSIHNTAIRVDGIDNTITLKEGSVIIGDIVLGTGQSGTELKMDVGAGRSYVYSVTQTNTTWTLTDLNGRTAIKGSAKSAAIGNVETADEMLGYRSQAINGSLYRFQRNGSKNSNFDFYGGNNKRTKAGTDTATYSQSLTGFTYVNPSESSNLGLVIGYQNSDLSIQSGAQNLDSNTLIAGIHNATDNGHVKALVTYTKSKASQEVLDNTSSTGYTTYKGDYSSYGAIVGFGTAIKKDFGSNQNISLMFDADISHERISAWNETATFKWKARSLTQATANLKTEWRLEDEDSLTYVNAGVSARSLMSGKKADYSIDTTNTSFSGGDASSTALTLGLGHESKLSENSSAKFGVDASFASGERSVSGWMSIESKF